MRGFGQLAPRLGADGRPAGLREFRVRAASQRHEILGSVVIPDAIDVMDVFVVPQKTTVSLFPDKAVLQHITDVVPRRAGLRVIGGVDVDVPGLGAPAAGEIVTVGSSCGAVVPAHIPHVIPSIGIGSLVGFLGDICPLPASAEAKPVGRKVIRRANPLACRHLTSPNEGRTMRFTISQSIGGVNHAVRQ